MGLIKQLQEIRSKERSSPLISIESTVASNSNTHASSDLEIRKFLNTYNDNSKSNSNDKVVDVVVVLGDWRLADSVKKNGVYNEEDFQTVMNLKKALSELNDHENKYTFTFLDHHATIQTDLSLLSPQHVILNLCDEGYKNEALLEAHIPAYLDMLGLTYSGSGLTCLGMCYDKAIVRAIAVSVGVPVPDELLVDPVLGDDVSKLDFKFPRFIKPAQGDNSIGITPGSVVHTQGELEKYVKELNGMFPDRPVLIQEYLTGAEYSVGIIGNSKTGFFHLPLLEVDYSELDANLPPILGYESKFIPESPYWNQIKYKEAESLSEIQKKRLYRNAELLFERCKCRDYARFDFRADADGAIKLLEVNPNPGWCWDGKLNKMAKMCGWSYSTLLGSIINEVQKRMQRAPSQ